MILISLLHQRLMIQYQEAKIVVVTNDNSSVIVQQISATATTAVLPIVPATHYLTAK